MVVSILDNDGNNNCLSEGEDISFGTQKCFMTSPDEDGVIKIQKPQREGESSKEDIINRVRIRKLKYNSPEMTTLT